MPSLDGRCPFCPGNDRDIECESDRVPTAGDWRARAVLNKYPITKRTTGAAADAVPHGGRDDAGVSPREAAVTLPGSDGFFVTAPAHGIHEVIIETRDHDRDLPDYEDSHLEMVMAFYRRRLQVIGNTAGVEDVALFRNRGRRAGSSQPHAHAQILGSAIPFADPARRHDVARAHYQERGESIVDGMLDRELADPVRIVATDSGGGDDFVMLCPFAPCHNRQVWIVPRRHRGSFASCPDELLLPLGHAIVEAVCRLNRITGGTDYNVVFRLPPHRCASAPAAYWYVDIVPGRPGGAGFELVTDMHVVTAAPEDVAQDLRAARRN